MLPPCSPPEVPPAVPPSCPPSELPPAAPPALPSPPSPPRLPPASPSGAIFCKRSGLRLHVFVAAGKGRAFAYDAMRWRSASVSFTKPYVSLSSPVAKAVEGAGRRQLRLVPPGRPTSFPAGLVATVTFNETAAIDYAQTRLEV